MKHESARSHPPIVIGGGARTLLRYKTYWDVYKPTASTGTFGPTYRALYGICKRLLKWSI